MDLSSLISPLQPFSHTFQQLKCRNKPIHCPWQGLNSQYLRYDSHTVAKQGLVSLNTSYEEVNFVENSPHMSSNIIHLHLFLSYLGFHGHKLTNTQYLINCMAGIIGVFMKYLTNATEASILEPDIKHNAYSQSRINNCS